MRNAVINAPVQTDQREWRTDGVDQHLVSLLDPASFEADQYRVLRHLLELKHKSKKVIGVTSAGAGDGKTTTAINLAGTLAHALKARILIWDLDLRTASLGPRLGLSARGRGAADLILDPDLSLNDVVLWHPTFHLSLLLADRPLMVPYELLKSPRLGELLEEARQQYDYVVVDTPPLVPVPDSRLIAERVDGFVMVVGAHRTPRRLLEDALNQIDPAKLIGIIFNGDDRPLSGYYGYGYGYHQGRGRRGGPGSGWVTSVSDAFRKWLGRFGE